ncbi:hypothetical protein MKW98_021715 [Papaver atlanticum]|uniref:Uncharacterized protein n=1 Tax=Papaver atlanticum TaxID=357466 RepID=A0AAD4SG31_9MAGN|nr:hypothetical protein MKW98_021715 [Papaver atlanticum]
MDKLVNQNILSRTGKDSYSISKLKCNEKIVMKEEMGVQVNQVGEKVQRGNDEDYLYMKALYHVLPLAYVTISELQSKLEGEADQAIVRKLLFKMTCDGYVEAESNPRLGSRVIRSESTVKKLIETMEIFGSQNISTCACSGLCYVGSNLTRTREISVDTHLNGLSRIQDQLGNNIPIGRNETAASRESSMLWNDKRKGDETACSCPSQGKGSRKTSTVKSILHPCKDENNGMEDYENTSLSVDSIATTEIPCIRPNQEKGSRKTSMVEEPILQNVKFCKNWQGLMCNRIGHGSTGFAFINPERIMMVTDGRIRGNEYILHQVPRRFSHEERRYVGGNWQWGWVPYDRLNSDKIFVIGNAPHQVLVACAGSTYWFEKGQFLTPFVCALIAYEIMNPDPEYVDPDLRPDAPENIHEKKAELLFGGFIQDGPEKLQAGRRPSLYFCDEKEYIEIISTSRSTEFTAEELKVKGIDYAVIGSGGNSAETILESYLWNLGLPRRYYVVRTLEAMQKAMREDDGDTGGRVSVAEITEAGVHFEYYNIDGSDPYLEDAIQGMEDYRY